MDAIGGTMLIRLPAARVTTAERDPRVQSIRQAGGPRVGTDAAEVVRWVTAVTYAYDGAGNVTKIQDDEFTYDVASRLVQSKINGQTRNYEYDAFGNRTKCLQGPTDCQGHTIVASNNRIVGSNAAPTVDIMRYGQPTNGAQTAFMVISPTNRNKTIHYRAPICRHQPCQ